MSMVKQFKQTAFFLTALSMIMAFGAPVVRAADPIQIKFSHQNNAYDADQLLGETFKKLIEEKTNGAFQVTVYPGTLTHSESEAMEFIKSGTVDMDTNSAGHIAGYDEDIQFLQLPYLFKNHSHYNVARQSDVIKKILADLEKKTGLIVLGIYSDCNGFAIASTKPINSIEDAKGTKLRCMQNPLFVDIYKDFGFAVTPTDWEELYTSLQTGLVEADDMGVYCNNIFKMSEVVKNYAILQQMWTQKILFISPKTWNKLSDDQKALVRSVAQEAIELTDAWQYAREEEAINKAKAAGVTITYPDTTPFKQASEKVYEKWFAKYPQWKEWYAELQYLDPESRMPAACKK
ncbi:MAG: TRAP transporter substrate-binding protein [Solidesulfovibrio sp. DCME]|uniref:TRAP transporter substrate-binding protein n=1 Tax=Solidesulfovibrio sp. DCME TaxID=3447380 RepID=UPI003D0B6B55